MLKSFKRFDFRYVYPELHSQRKFVTLYPLATKEFYMRLSEFLCKSIDLFGPYLFGFYGGEFIGAGGDIFHMLTSLMGRLCVNCFDPSILWRLFVNKAL